MALQRSCVAWVSSTVIGWALTATAGDLPRNEIRFAISPQFPPYESRDEHGQLVGLNIELGNALCQQLNTRCIWVDQFFADSIPALQSRRFDAVMGIAPTPQRRQWVDFTDDLHAVTTRLVAHRHSGLIPTVRSLKGKRVGVLAGSNREAFAQTQWAPAGVIVESFWLNDQLIRSLLAGDIDAALQGPLEVREALLNTPEGQSFDFVGPAVSAERLGKGVAIAVRKSDTTLRDELNRALEQLRQNGEYQRIAAPYLLVDPPPMPLRQADPQYYPAASGLAFSEAVKVGNTLYLSDILGLDARRRPVPGGVAVQMKQAMNVLRETLERHHSALDQVLKCTLSLADIDDLRQVEAVYLSYFAADRLPALSVHGVRRLPRKAAVAIECIALTHDQEAPEAGEMTN